MTEGRAVVEVWHKVPKSESRAAPVSGAVFGRRLGPAFRDVCLGQAIVPLTQLIEKQSGTYLGIALNMCITYLSIEVYPYTVCTVCVLIKFV